MNSKRGLMTVLVGFAMLATPMAAAAKDYHHNDSHAARVEARAANASARSYVATRNYDRAVRHDEAAYRGYGYRGYVAPGYVGAPAYAAAPYYGGGYGGGGYGGGSGCGAASRVMNTYYRDRNTGHPAAAYDLLARNRWAFNSGCAGAAPVGGGLFGGVPAYNSYGGNGLLGGLLGGSPAPTATTGPHTMAADTTAVTTSPIAATDCSVDCSADRRPTPTTGPRTMALDTTAVTASPTAAARG